MWDVAYVSSLFQPQGRYRAESGNRYMCVDVHMNRWVDVDGAAMKDMLG